jgi:hypothetical protein
LLDVDVYSFQAAAGAKVTIRTNPLVDGVPMDTFLRLFDAAGNQLTFNDDSEGYYSLISDFTLTAAGTYYVGVSAYPNGSYDPAFGGSGVPGTGGDYGLSVTVSAPVALPEMDVIGNGVAIVDGAAAPSSADGTDFGNQDVGNGVVTRTFTIANAGVGALNLTGTPLVQITGSNASDFVVTMTPSASVAAGGSTSFQISFDPTASGLRTATLSIASNDANESPYEFAIQGMGTVVAVPDVAGDTLATALNLGLPAAGGSAAAAGRIGDGAFGAMDVDFYSFQASAGSTVTLQTMQPAGAAAMDTYLRLFDAAGNLLAANDDSGSYYSLIANFTLAAAGTYYVGVSGYPNSGYDPNVGGSGAPGSAGDYQLAVTLSAPVAAPEINVTGKSVSIVDGDASPGTVDGTDFGGQNVTSGSVTKTFTITNTGSGALNLNGPIQVVAADGAAGANDFTVTAPPASSIAAGGSTTLQITFNPSASGLRRAKIVIANNDGDENPFEFVVQGIGVSSSSREIDLRGNDVVIVDGDATPSPDDFTDFGVQSITDGAVVRTFEIVNLGGSSLSLSGSTRVQIGSVSGSAGASDFRVVAQPGSSVAAGGRVAFQIAFDPSAAGLRKARVTITNNDSNEGTYDFVIQGTGFATPAPEIEVRNSNGTAIIDGDSSPSASDLTDFGSANVPNGNVTRTFTIVNTGTLPLNLTGAPLVQVAGAHAGDFTVVQPGASTIPAGESFMFQVVFDPIASGLRTATISIASNDGDESLYDFAIQGTGTVAPVEPGNTLATALATGLGPASGVLVMPGNAIGDGSQGSRDVDLYSFQAVAGSSITLETSRPSGGRTMDTYLRLFDANGNQLRSDNNTGSGDYSRISNFTLSSTGTYFVGVSGNSNTSYNAVNGGSGRSGSTGDYQLALTLNSPAGNSTTVAQTATLPSPSSSASATQAHYAAIATVNGPTGATRTPASVAPASQSSRSSLSIHADSTASLTLSGAEPSAIDAAFQMFESAGLNWRMGRGFRG